MKRYSLSEIMKTAWNLRKVSLKWVTSLSSGKYPHRAWKSTREAVYMFSGLVRNIQVGRTLAYPVPVDTDMDALTVTDGTYPVRNTMHEFGLVWDRDNKAWTSGRGTPNSTCVKYA